MSVLYSELQKEKGKQNNKIKSPREKKKKLCPFARDTTRHDVSNLISKLEGEIL